MIFTTHWIDAEIEHGAVELTFDTNGCGRPPTIMSQRPFLVSGIELLGHDGEADALSRVGIELIEGNIIRWSIHGALFRKMPEGGALPVWLPIPARQGLSVRLDRPVEIANLHMAVIFRRP